ncbi:MAG TPA: type II toxin-antitoxin system VapC family toxin [Gemmataceae bacterium]|nr:type II toxin-antitoxin system VapC family toxin [Gemmataceae bacterium]
MKYLLDTNTCVQYLRKGSASPISTKLSNFKPGDVVLCSVVVAELLYGALRSRDVANNLTDVRTFVARFSSPDFDAVAAEEYAKIRADLAAKGTPIGPNDLMIAAIALTHGLTLVTHNTTEFSRVNGLTLEDWQTP